MARSRFTRYNDREVSSGPSYKKQRIYSTKKTYMKKPGKMDLYKIVKNVLNRNIETEISSHTLALQSFNSGIDSAGDVLRLVPTIPQGTDDGARKGSIIMAKSLNIRGHFQLTSIDSTIPLVIPPNARVGVRLMCVTPKRFPNYIQSATNSATWLPNLLRNGVSTQGFTGTVQDLYLPINLDEVTVHWDQLVDITSEFVYAPAASSFTTINPAGSYRFFNFNVKCKDRKLHFVDGSSEPTDFGPVLLMGYAHMDNSSPDVVTTRVAMSYVSTLKYTDA